MVLFKDESLELIVQNDEVSLKVFKTYELKQFNELLLQFPRVAVLNFVALKTVLQSGSYQGVGIGMYRPEIEVEISTDEMTALLRLNMTESDKMNRMESLRTEIIGFLEEKGVREGILTEMIDENMPVQKKFPIAKGIPPQNGVDAEIKYFEFSEKKPVLTSDDKADYYDIQLIDDVETGDWLGEKIPATEGITGKTVRGNVVVPKAGRDFAIKFEQESVEAIEEENRIVLRAKRNGAARMRDDKICVDNHLMIYGDVGTATGNIDFDGYVTIAGTVCDTYSVTATHDIVINGLMGIGAIQQIESKMGSISIKGGVNGKSVAKIIAAKNVYLKYINETYVKAEGNIHIGLYAYDSELYANKVELSKDKGKIVGGKTYAHHQIVTGSIGTKFEKKTEVNVKGFNRKEIVDELEMMKFKFNDILSRANKLKRQLEIFEANQEKLDERAFNTYKALLVNYESIMSEIGKLTDKTDRMEEMLRTRGDGEVKVYNEVFPKSVLEIKNLQKRVVDLMTCSFYVKDNELHLADV